MMKHRYLITYIVALVIQILLSEYLNISQYIILSVLPVLVLCLPLSLGTVTAMFIAFSTGLVADFFTDGVLGMTSFSLVPAAVSRRFIISLVFGTEVFSLGNNLSVRRHGIGKFILPTLMITAVYFLFYIPLDSAGVWTFGGNVLRCLLSVFFSFVVEILFINSIATE